MAQPKYTIYKYKYVRFKDGSWRFCRAALYANHTIKPDVVTVGGREEKHPEGNYYSSYRFETRGDRRFAVSRPRRRGISLV